MRSVLSTLRSRQVAKRSAGVVELANSDPEQPGKKLRSLGKYFWYTSPDGAIRLVTSSQALSEIPQQVNDYTFDQAIFAQSECPPTLPTYAVWPPREARDMLYATGLEGEECVGNTFYDATPCSDPSCKHTFKRWKVITEMWHDHFELRKTDNRGIGVYTKRAFKKKDVLGWYAGQLVTSVACDSKNAYLMTVPIGVAYNSDDDTDSGSSSDNDSEYSPSGNYSTTESTPKFRTRKAHMTNDTTVLIDASKQGNWTRFINHSCEPHTEFRMYRVGNMRIMVVEAITDVPEGVELTVNYGEEYYGPDTMKICQCGTVTCVSNGRKKI
jgi:hypothetical protein